MDCYDLPQSNIDYAEWRSTCAAVYSTQLLKDYCKSASAESVQLDTLEVSGVTYAVKLKCDDMLADEGRDPESSEEVSE